MNAVHPTTPALLFHRRTGVEVTPPPPPPPPLLPSLLAFLSAFTESTICLLLTRTQQVLMKSLLRQIKGFFMCCAHSTTHKCTFLCCVKRCRHQKRVTSVSNFILPQPPIRMSWALWTRFIARTHTHTLTNGGRYVLSYLKEQTPLLASDVPKSVEM